MTEAEYSPNNIEDFDDFDDIDDIGIDVESLFGMTDDNIEELRAEAQQYLATEDFESAWNIVVVLQSLCPDDERIAVVHAELLIHFGNSLEAEEALLEFLEFQPNNLGALISLAHARVLGAQAEGLQELFDLIKQLDPGFESPNGPRALGVMHKAWKRGHHPNPPPGY